MKYFIITFFICGRKKIMRGVRGFPATYREEDVRYAMAEMLLYYYFRKDILKIDVLPMEENNVKEQEKSDKKVSHVC